MDEDDIFVMLYLAGVQNQKLSEELHKLQNPTTDTLYAAAEAWEIAQQQKKLIDSSAAGRVQSASSYKQTKNQGSGPPNPGHRPNSFQRNTGNKQPKQEATPTQGPAYRCFRCGSRNDSHNCAALDAHCKYCGKKGHFQGVCNARAKATQKGGQSKSKVRQATVSGPANLSSAQQASSQ